jgi:hypothetical protein
MSEALFQAKKDLAEAEFRLSVAKIEHEQWLSRDFGFVPPEKTIILNDFERRKRELKIQLLAIDVEMWKWNVDCNIISPLNQ